MQTTTHSHRTFQRLKTSVFAFLILSFPVFGQDTYTYLTKIGSRGSGNGQFDMPISIRIAENGKIYVLDLSNRRIQKFNEDGSFHSKWGTAGTGDGQFAYPLDLAIDKNGFVYVVDSENYNVQKFDTTGKFITKWGGPGSGDYQFIKPRGVALDDLGNVYIQDNATKIKKYTSSGTFIKTLSRGGSSIAINGKDMYVSSDDWHYVAKYDTANNYKVHWGTEGSADGQFDSPGRIAIDKNKNVFVADYYNNRVQKFDSTGKFLAKMGSGGTGNGQFDHPNGVAVAKDGKVYVTDVYNGRVNIFAPQTPTGMTDNTSEVTIRLFPNPSNGSFAVQTFGTEGILLIQKSDGTTQQQVATQTGLREYSITGLERGAYLITFRDNRGSKVLKAIVN